MKRYRSPRELASEVSKLLRSHRPLGPRATKQSPLDRVAGLLYDGRHYFWIGIYLVIGERVVRQVFRGPVPPCHAFAFGQGNVGTTGERGLTKVIPDVTTDPTYSMCFLETRSEIVVPIRLGRRTLGVIDVESDRPHAFGRTDQALLKTVAAELARFLISRGRYLVRRAKQGEAAKAESATAKPIEAEPARSGPQAERPEPAARLAAAAGEGEPA